MPESGRPSIRSGRRPSLVSTCAPISESGDATRSIGRELSESSPVSSKRRPSWPARRPGSNRASVPAFPQSIGASGSRSPESPTPCRRTTSAVLVHRDAECAHGCERRLRVERSAEAANDRLAVAHSPHEQCAVRDRFVAGHTQRPSQAYGGRNLHHSRPGYTGPSGPRAHSSSGHGVASMYVTSSPARGPVRRAPSGSASGRPATTASAACRQSL